MVSLDPERALAAAASADEQLASGAPVGPLHGLPVGLKDIIAPCYGLAEATLAVAVVLMTFALVGLAVGFGARYPRFGADATQAAGSYGGVAFMVLAVLYLIVMVVLLGWPSSMWLFSRLRGIRMSSVRETLMVASFACAVVLSVATSWWAMRSGVNALERMRH